MDFIVVLKRTWVRPGLELDEASLLDLAPTILHYLGLPVPANMDGRVLTEAFSDAFNAGNPVQIAAGETAGDDQSDEVYTAAEEELVLAKLRDLGYVA
jgi:hypothetical protein